MNERQHSKAQAGIPKEVGNQAQVVDTSGTTTIGCDAPYPAAHSRVRKGAGAQKIIQPIS